MSDRHTAVWIDQREAHVFHVGAEAYVESIVLAPEHLARHPQREAPPHNHPDDEQRFFERVAQSLSGAEQILVVGPSKAKLHFRDYVLEHPSLKLSIAGVETVDHPTDNQIAAYVRQYFRSADPAVGPH